MRTLYCPSCGSTNVDVCMDVEIGEDTEMECEDCGHIEIVTRLDPSEYF